MLFVSSAKYAYQILQPPRAKHCDLCGHCIPVYDHHCHYIFNCVGRDNFYFFIFFLTVLLIYLVVHFVLLLYILIGNFAYDPSKDLIDWLFGINRNTSKTYDTFMSCFDIFWIVLIVAFFLSTLLDKKDAL